MKKLTNLNVFINFDFLAQDGGWQQSKILLEPSTSKISDNIHEHDHDNRNEKKRYGAPKTPLLTTDTYSTANHIFSQS